MFFLEGEGRGAKIQNLGRWSKKQIPLSLNIESNKHKALYISKNIVNLVSDLSQDTFL